MWYGDAYFFNGNSDIEETKLKISTREPTHKEVIFCKMNLKLDELC